MPPRRIRDGEEYTIDEDVELELPIPFDEPPIAIQGEPWGWNKPGDKPRGWRLDGKYDNDTDRDPGPFDGNW
jgi:hypothetical protein